MADERRVLAGQERRAAEAHAHCAAETGERRAAEARPHVLTGSKGQERRRAKRGINNKTRVYFSVYLGPIPDSIDA